MTNQDPPPPEHAALEHLAHAPLPTRFGAFELHVYRWDDPASHPSLSNEHLVMVLGEVRGQRGVATRVHSECLTSEAFSSLKCDCKEQLDWALAEIARRGCGVVMYLRQEGRGIGLANKIRAYALQAQGADTIEANELLHLPVDARQYGGAAAILRDLGVESVALMTNNPSKVNALARLGIQVDERIPTLVAANPFSAPYLEAKKKKLSHELPSGVFHQKAETEPAGKNRHAGKDAKRE